MIINKMFKQPAGTMISKASGVIPDGFLECNGAAISRALYADLFADIGTSWGAGDGSTTFNIPDMRGEFPRGWDNGRGVDLGRAIGASQAEEYKSHNHSGTFRSTNQAYSFVKAGTTGVPSTMTAYNSPVNKTSNVPAQGGAETRPRNMAVMYLIKY